MAFWRKPYVPVAQRREKARQEIRSLLKKGQVPQPIAIEGRAMAASFWGKAWCTHFESFSDYSNRLPRGKTYARNGSIVHLDISSGRIDAVVSGSSLYKISVVIAPLPRERWKAIVQKAAGGIGSIIELLRGEFSNEIMGIVTDPADGLFPKSGEIKLDCSCPDWAEMCKHLAAVLYGVGNRLDSRPDLLFLLRGVDPQELISTDIALPSVSESAHAIPDNALAGLFGITLDLETPANRAKPKCTAASPPARKAKGKAARDPKLPKTAKKFTGITVLRLRKRLKMSHAEFAAAAGVSVPTVKRWESILGELRMQSAPLQALHTLMDSRGK